ncbi:MAG: 2-hydroxyhepta-2,4-diene-1,7-dioate isomerase [marine bacterium B5-7]|nr:MAG: 2-hydroxyhepta-2,4-diene-1,7-dioate isomerase [marine bacterium B5-7]
MSSYGLATYLSTAQSRAALVFDQRLVDLSDAAKAVNGDAEPGWLAGGLDGIFRQWEDVRDEIDALANSAAKLVADGTLKLLPEGTRVAPPLRPERMFCAASNYIEHAEEMGTVLAAKANSNPFIFMKAPSCIVGNGDAVVKPTRTEMLDWEVELGVVIGRRCRYVSIDNALDVIAGYTIVNDVTARDLNVRDDFPFKFDWFQGKSWDTFGPIGPWVIPASVFGDPHDVSLKLSVNDELMQDGNTNKLIFNIAEQIAYLSDILTLLPGDVIATGTPDGVGMGRGVYLHKGDVMKATIAGIGSLTNPITDEADSRS